MAMRGAQTGNTNREEWREESRREEYTNTRKVRKGTIIVKTSTMWLTRREKGMKEIRQGLTVKERSNVGEQTKRRGGSSWEERRKEEGQSKKRQNRGGDQKSLAQPIPIGPGNTSPSPCLLLPPPAAVAARPAWQRAKQPAIHPSISSTTSIHPISHRRHPSTPLHHHHPQRHTPPTSTTSRPPSDTMARVSSPVRGRPFLMACFTRQGGEEV